MCAGAIRWAQLGRVVFGTQEEKYGYTRYQPLLFHPRTKVSKGILQPECAGLMKAFFQRKRT
ncbi:MAG: nucleoside deaminase, partial [Bacteroidota bacterium]